MFSENMWVFFKPNGTKDDCAPDSSEQTDQCDLSDETKVWHPITVSRGLSRTDDNLHIPMW